MIISRPIHVAANGIISFFLWLILHIFLLVWDQQYLRNLYCLTKCSYETRWAEKLSASRMEIVGVWEGMGKKNNNNYKKCFKEISFVFHLLPPHPTLFIFLQLIYCMEMPRMSQVQFKFLSPLLTVRDKLFKIFPRICPQSLLGFWTQQFVQIPFPLLLILAASSFWFLSLANLFPHDQIKW